MAHGNPDYWAQPITGLPVPSVYQTAARAEGFAIIAGGGNADLGSYTVPAGHRLYIASGKIVTNGPGINQWQWRKNGFLGMVRYFDTDTPLPLNPSGMLWYVAGDTIELRVTNLDTVAWNFYIEWYGFLVTIVPALAAPAATGLGIAIAGAGI